MPGQIVNAIDGLTERQRLAVHYLSQGKTIREVSRLLGVSEKTIYLYRQKPAVQRAILYAQQDMMEMSAARNITTVPDAIQTLTDIVNDPEARDSDRIAASRALISGANALAERRILERQLGDLEAALLRFTSPAGAPSAAPPAEGPLDPLLPSANPADYDD
jgi:transposase-like protein